MPEAKKRSLNPDLVFRVLVLGDIWQYADILIRLWSPIPSFAEVHTSTWEWGNQDGCESKTGRPQSTTENEQNSVEVNLAPTHSTRKEGRSRHPLTG